MRVSKGWRHSNILMSYPINKHYIKKKKYTPRWESLLWGIESCSDASVLRSLWDARMQASLIIQLSTYTFHIFMNEERYWMLGCCDWLQRTHSITHPPKHTHTHTEKERGDVMLRFRSASRESDCLWLMLKTLRERASGEGSLFILIFSLAAPGAQWCNTGDLFVTDHPRFLLAADWLSARMNEPLCSPWGGGLGGVRQKHVTCSLRGKKRKWRKNCWLPWQKLWIELKWVCMLISLFVTHVGRMHEGDSESSLYSGGYTLLTTAWSFITGNDNVIAIVS